MPDTHLTFDHVHLVAKDPQVTVDWYVDNLGGKVVKSVMSHNAPQIYVSFGGPMIIVRGQRTGETAAGKSGLEFGVDHFGMRVRGDFNAFCAGLKSKGVAFSLEPTDINPATRIAFVKAPDGVSVELLDRKDQA